MLQASVDTSSLAEWSCLTFIDELNATLLLTELLACKCMMHKNGFIVFIFAKCTVF